MVVTSNYAIRLLIKGINIKVLTIKVLTIKKILILTSY